MNGSELTITIWVVLGLAVVWSDRASTRSERVTADEADVYNTLRGF